MMTNHFAEDRMLVRVGYHNEENIVSFDEAAQVGVLIGPH